MLSCLWKLAKPLQLSEEVVKREEAKQAPVKVLKPLIYLKDVNDISFEAVETEYMRVQKQCVKAHIPYHSLEVSYPTELIESVLLGTEKPNLHSLYLRSIYYVSRLPDDDCVSDIAARLKSKTLTDRRAPKLSDEKAVYLDIVKDDLDDEDWEASSCNPVSLVSRCPPWLLPEMRLVKRAMLRGDEVAYRKLRGCLLERVNTVM